MRFLVLALVVCAGTSGFCQSPAPVLNPKSDLSPSGPLPNSWLNAERARLIPFGTRADANAGMMPRQFVLNPQMSTVLMARNDAAEAFPPRLPHANAEPLPGEWPNLKREPIPTTWPKLKLLLVDGGATQRPAHVK